jgi:hypothetical protein
MWRTAGSAGAQAPKNDAVFEHLFTSSTSRVPTQCMDQATTVSGPVVCKGRGWEVCTALKLVGDLPASVTWHLTPMTAAYVHSQ